MDLVVRQMHLVSRRDDESEVNKLCIGYFQRKIHFIIVVIMSNNK